MLDAKELKLKANHNCRIPFVYFFRDAKELKLKANHNNVVLNNNIN